MGRERGRFERGEIERGKFGVRFEVFAGLSSSNTYKSQTARRVSKNALSHELQRKWPGVIDLRNPCRRANR